MPTLLLQLKGPLQSWAAEDGYTHRNTGSYPPKAESSDSSHPLWDVPAEATSATSQPSDSACNQSTRAHA